MGLLDRLLKKLKRTEDEPKEVSVELKDILFDWFNDNGDSVEDFNKGFLVPCIEFYKKDDHTRQYIEAYPDKSFEQHFNQHAILYLAAKFPDNKRFETLFDYLFNKANQTYSIKDSVRNIPSRNQFDSDHAHLWEVLKAGNVILKIYHAIYENRDQNISSISSLPSYIMSLTTEDNKNVFHEVFKYLNRQNFEDKLFVLLNAVPTDASKYCAESIGRLTSERQKAFTSFNSLDSITIPESLVIDFESSFFNIPNTDLVKNTEWRKQKYLKLADFSDVLDFLKANADKRGAIIKYYLLKNGMSYVSRDLIKVHRGLFAHLQKDLCLSASAFSSILNTKITANHSLIYNELLAPLLRNSSIEGLSEDIIFQFESKLLADIAHYNDYNEFQTCFDAILNRSRAHEDPLSNSIGLAKYNKLYGGASFSNNLINLNINSSKQGGFAVNRILDRLNLIFPSSLKFLAKQPQHVYYENKLCTLNINGSDHDFTSNIVIELNELLESKHAGYRFLPIIIQKNVPNKSRGADQSLFQCSIELLNYSQFEFLKKTQLSTYSVSTSKLIQNIVYHVQDAPLLTHSENSVTEEANSTAFKSSPSWKWFKEDYIDKLESSTNWYDIMDLHIRCKGTSKPNSKWSLEINDAITKFGRDRYFKELGSLMSSSLNESFWFLDNYRTAIKGIVWSCALNANSESLSIIKSIVESSYTKIPGIGPKSAKLGNLSLNALVLSNSNEAFGLLNLIRNRSTYQRFIKAIDKCIDKYLSDYPGDAEELADKTIPDFGFEHAKKTVEVDNEISAVIVIENRRLVKRWIINQKLHKTTPSLIKEKYKTQEKEVASEFKRINAAFKQLKDRISTYWLYNRTWKYDFWHEQIFSHSLLNCYLQSMIWYNESTRQSFIFRDGSFVNAFDEPISSNPDDIVSLWHPVISTPPELSSWQQYIFSNQINQSLRQAFREHYPFSAEELEKKASSRFAHHFLIVRKLMAIANSAGWLFTYEHEGFSWPRKFIKPLNLTVHFKCDYQRFDYAIPSKDFYVTSGNTVNINTRAQAERLQFANISTITLSEVCRDVDLFIATTSIANDPELSLKTEQQEFYREDFDVTYFSHNATAKIRKQVIGIIGSSIGVDPIFDKNYLIVQGKLNKYRINLGSGFAQLADSQKHINLLPEIQPLKKSKKTHTPIQDDETLYIILAKAKFLLNDHEIDDPKFKNAIEA